MGGKQSAIADPGFGKMVKRKRVECDMTRRELASYSGLDPSLVTLIERDNHVPGPENCISMAKAMNVDEDWFMLMAGYATSNLRKLLKNGLRLDV